MPRNLYQQKDINGKKLPQGDLVVDGELIVSGGANFGGNVAVTGTLSAANVSASTALNASGTFQVSGAATFLGNLTATTGVNKILVPGVYANDAAAAAAGIPVGGLYRLAAGALTWRQV